MRRFLLFFIFFSFTFRLCLAQRPKVNTLQCDDKTNPINIDSKMPKLSWQVDAKERAVEQTSYQIIVADNISTIKKNRGNIWESGVVKSSKSVQVLYKGPVLKPTETYYWRVRIWDNKNHSSKWSAINFWQMGLLQPADWEGAKWIAYQKMDDSLRILPGEEFVKGQSKGTLNDTLPLFRKVFSVRKKIKRARVYISGLGHFELSINGKKIGDHFLDPGWVNYQKQALYVSFDVTKNLREGENAIGVILGNGFYYIPQVKHRYKKLLVQYGYPKMISRLLIEFSDGSVQNIISDKTWKATPSPITFSSIYGGEDYNGCMELKNWSTINFNDKNWMPVKLVDGPPELNAQAADPVKIENKFIPKGVVKLNDSSWVYDLGQNASGIPEIMLSGKRGDTITLIPGELLHKDSSANQNATGKPYLLHYILKGGGIEIWHPLFTYYGFRYVQVNGAVPKGKENPRQLPVIESLKGLHTSNDAKPAGSFSCSNKLFNRTFNLINWSIKNNMASLFTDCPHREKLGWLEELHLMGNSVHFNFQVYNLLKKSIEDMKLAQTPDGLIPEIAPEYTVFTYGGDMFRDSPEWGSSSIIIPWYLYRWYGDSTVLATSYSMMKRYANYLLGKANNYILTEGLGDWYDLGPNPPGVSQLTPKGLTATAIYFYDLNILRQTATLLHQPNDIVRFGQLANQVKEAFNKRFYDPQKKQYGSGSQTSNAMALYMQLVPEDLSADVLKNLVDSIVANKYALTAGDIGYRYVLKVLEDAGRSDIIYKMNNRSDVPGYGYQLAKGATSLTESWQALPSVSNDHFMLGHLMEWFYTGLAGIRQAENSIAYKQIIIQPNAVGDIDWVNANYQSPYGLIQSNWIKKPKEFELNLSIPPNTTAKIYLPADKNSSVTESGKKIKYRYEDGKAVVSKGSGVYHFVVKE
ncbi:family 78 glycoside hydrolase catalytic domain [Arachidicoccus soli]|uniref:alpha-L-rhamnosidase n=1 Tax=Arachidicoccus soli TaxID=2341117 RepID=A0A386HPN1_9BACT|nr:family 78 glycoside hydrolase catalytic domain [Arachidicoccus soli]AYD47652.1 alpha-L-rhamnosidase [Arachidicoccus soli]